MNIKLSTVVLLFLLYPLLAVAQDQSPEEQYLQSRIEQRKLDRERWSEITKDINYTQKKRRRAEQKPERSGTGGERPATGGSFDAGAWAPVARFILILTGVVLIALLVRSMLGYGSAKNKKIPRQKETIDVRKIEENLHEADLPDYIQQAVNAGHFNLAIRLYYLAVLKELSLQKKIRWKTDKTNSEYLREMRDTPYFDDFRALTLTFERSWYGDRPLDGAHFAQLEPMYRRFLDQLQPAPQAMTP